MIWISKPNEGQLDGIGNKFKLFELECPFK